MEEIKINIDEIKEKYKFEINLSENKYLLSFYEEFFIKLIISFNRYKFKDKIKILYKKLDDNKIHLKEEQIKAYEKQIKDVSEEIDELYKKMYKEYYEDDVIMLSLNLNYNSYKNKSGVLDVKNYRFSKRFIFLLYGNYFNIYI